jgi:hypothetical protein
MIRASGIFALTVVVGLCQPTAAAGPQPSLKDVLSRLETYLSRYESQLAMLVAEEQYEQWVQPATGGPSTTTRRTLTSDFGFLRLPGRSEWLGLRDTIAVDGQPVPGRQDGRLARLLSEGMANTEDLAQRIVDENARYNLGVVERTINVPMVALDFLSRRNRWRLAFRKRSEEQVNGRTIWAVTFSERERPTLVKTPQGRDRPARGTLLIDPQDGSVLRTDLEFDAGNGGDAPATTITVLYRPDETLGLLVPYEMREAYRKQRGAPEEMGALANYTNFRQFQTSARIIPR